MNVGELYVNLGITGADKTVGSLGNVKKGLGEVSSASLEAKAAILAAMYGLERLMSASGAAGTGFTNFTALTGISAQTLQQWQYAARQAGVSGEELSGSMKAVQNSMSNMLLGKGAPEGMKVVANAVGGIDINRVRDVTYMMGKLQQAAQSLPKDIGNNVLKSFGLSEGTIAAMRRNAFNPAAFKAAPTYSDHEVGQLDKANVAWSNLSNKIEMAMGHFNAKHGLSLVNDISKVTDQVFRLIEAFTKLAEQQKIFEAIGMVFKGWSLIFEGIGNVIKEKVDTQERFKKDPHSKEFQNTGVMKHQLDWLNRAVGLEPSPKWNEEKGQPAAGPTNINTTVHNHGVKDTHESVDHLKKHVNQAFRQRSAVGQGS